MKRIFIILVATLLLAGCHKNKAFETYTVSGERCFLQISDEPFIFNLDTIGAKITYSIVWPGEGMVSETAMRELQYLYFYDSTVNNIADAHEYWLDPNCIDGWFFYPDETVKILPTDHLDEEQGYSYFWRSSQSNRRVSPLAQPMACIRPTSLLSTSRRATPSISPTSSLTLTCYAKPWLVPYKTST